jgi:hypothetical protein
VHARQYIFVIVRAGGCSRSEKGGGVHMHALESVDVYN